MYRKFLSLIAVVLVLSIPGLVTCQEWITANQVTVVWDPVTKFDNGDPIPSNNLIEYTVYLVRESDKEKVNPIELITVSSTTYTITLGVEGKYYVGLQTVRHCSNGVDVTRSVIGWSDDPFIVADGMIFGVCYYLSPAGVSNLHPIAPSY
uniref:Fibronectin type-III domain-containing protein n=1 Tax=viral metagenome TaxID=1070528 RepID=A0A6M3LG54_9ZZZZ